MKHVQSCLRGREIEKAVFKAVEAVSGWWKPVYVQRRSRKQFALLWLPCEVGASLFMCRKNLITPF